MGNVILSWSNSLLPIKLSKLKLRNGKGAACNHGVMECTREVAKHKRSVRVARGDSQVRL